jgi:hypothetical protein
MLRRVALVITDVSELLSVSFLRVTRIGKLGKTLAVTNNQRTLRRNVLSLACAGVSLGDGPLSLCYCDSCVVPCMCWCIPRGRAVVPVLLWLLCCPLHVLVYPWGTGRCPCVTVALVLSLACAGVSLGDRPLSLCYCGSCATHVWAVDSPVMTRCPCLSYTLLWWRVREIRQQELYRRILQYNIKTKCILIQGVILVTCQ